ncbi:unnamed protein product [Triticum turgidum subsp. durum]|uniref:Sugar phosphate transporter domain-containing protein n=1 Tax=Triticum turgidum subsp. durum TaxID=4567 RepID=A0A9R0RDS2_TRITD|nr:unnamed protein product [Triticum turgidum subsp. durum]
MWHTGVLQSADGGRCNRVTGGSAIEIDDEGELGAMIVAWYLLNIYFNIYNKQVLQVLPLPLPYTITAFQLAFGSLVIFFMWAAKLHPVPKLSAAQLAKIAPLAAGHMLGTVFTNMSLGKVAVSFTHTVKASEPFFTVLLSAFFLGEVPSPLVLGSLVPIVGGVALASLTEVSFNWVGFWSAMASNLLNQTRNVLSKRLLGGEEEEFMDDINLFSVITVLSFLLSLPLMIFAEGVSFSPAFLQSTGLNLQELCVRAALAGLCFHGYQKLSYMILARVSPVTHSVANCVKRVVVIVSSVLFFRTPISPVNALGTGAALAGVYLYSRLKKAKPKSS